MKIIVNFYFNQNLTFYFNNIIYNLSINHKKYKISKLYHLNLIIFEITYINLCKIFHHL